MSDLSLTRLKIGDGAALSRLLQGDDESYAKFFSPFDKDIESIEAMLAAAKEDCYWGLWFVDILVGFFMLRGFDAGYDRPAFGIYIAKSHSNLNLSKVALEYSLCWCQLNGIRALMLKVHPDNYFAKQVYKKAGLKFVEICPRTGQHVMEICWS